MRDGMGRRAVDGRSTLEPSDAGGERHSTGLAEPNDAAGNGIAAWYLPRTRRCGHVSALIKLATPRRRPRTGAASGRTPLPAPDMRVGDYALRGSAVARGEEGDGPHEHHDVRQNLHGERQLPRAPHPRRQLPRRALSPHDAPS